MDRLVSFVKKEIVLCAAMLLAAASALIVPPDRQYADYIDFRTLGILFCLMCVMAGLQQTGLFHKIAKALLGRVRKTNHVMFILVLLCFVFSMLITNDVALITFVPFTFTVGRLLGEKIYRKMVIPTVVFQTIAANLGSMLTPIGNPQNLYLFSISGMSLTEFIMTMLPYSAFSLGMVIASTLFFGKLMDLDREWRIKLGAKNNRQDEPASEGQTGTTTPEQDHQNEKSDKCVMFKTAVYLILFVLCLFVVARVLPLRILFWVVLAFVFVMDRKVLGRVDYCLLLTFVGFFVFIGNMGRIPAVSNLLKLLVSGHEVLVSVVASQCISNVPAALLLSEFTQNIRGLMIGTNLGGLGTLIASMASLISYKYVAVEAEQHYIPGGKWRYFYYFTFSNVLMLAALLIFHKII